MQIASTAAYMLSDRQYKIMKVSLQSTSNFSQWRCSFCRFKECCESINQPSKLHMSAIRLSFRGISHLLITSHIKLFINRVLMGGLCYVIPQLWSKLCCLYLNFAVKFKKIQAPVQIIMKELCHSKAIGNHKTTHIANQSRTHCSQ